MESTSFDGLGGTYIRLWISFFKLVTGKFSSEWQKGNVAPIHKKNDKWMLKTTSCIILTHMWYNIECLIYNVINYFLFDNNIFSPNQAGFRSGDYCINGFISINHKILNAFDKEFDVHGIFIDITKAFEKVWHDDLSLKQLKNGVSRDIINILREFLRKRKQRVVLNSQCSSWPDVRASVQGSILGPLLFLIYINDLHDGLKSKCKLFLDGTSLFSKFYDINTTTIDVNDDFLKVTWFLDEV